ncbi:MAG: hypothetical protein JKY89_10820 [Immundisolibacteraceae bacterium]|nr:hypothetical protein [Immundisolibacteraceae bacterium]
MAATKLFDAVVKTGEYTNGNNEVKGRYENVGSIMQGENGMFLILKRTFNAAGVPNPDNKDSVIVSFFEADNNKQGQQQGGYQQAAPQQGGFNQQQAAPQQQGGFGGQQQQQAPQQGGYGGQRG